MKRVTLSHHNNAAVIVSPPRSPPGWLALPYAAWAGVTFLILSLLALLVVLLLPGQTRRRRVARRAARIALWVAGMRLIVQRAQLLPDSPAIVVANHASYLDGIVLFAALPPTYGFVIKREMDGVPLAGLLLRRLGSHFVDRRGAQHGARDSRPLLKQARAGSALAFFPEGTFHHAEGLARFHSGAFRVAANAHLPVVPVAIRGTRRALPPASYLPRPGHIEVEVTTPLPPPAESDEQSLRATMRAARLAILARIPEPDLAPDEPAPAT